MSCVQLSEGDFRWFTPLACGSGCPELFTSDMACKLFTFMSKYALVRGSGIDRAHSAASVRGQSIARAKVATAALPCRRRGAAP